MIGVWLFSVPWYVKHKGSALRSLLPLAIRLSKAIERLGSYKHDTSELKISWDYSYIAQINALTWLVLAKITSTDWAIAFLNKHQVLVKIGTVLYVMAWDNTTKYLKNVIWLFDLIYKKFSMIKCMGFHALL